MKYKKRREKEQNNLNESLSHLAEELSTNVMAKVIAQHGDIDPSTALVAARHYGRRTSLGLDLPDQEGFQVRSQGQSPKINLQAEKTRIKKMIALLQRSLEEIDRQSEEGPGVLMEFDFPVDKFIKRIAEHTGESVDRLEQKFHKQLEQALTDMVETGEGYLPDFGVIHYGDGEETECVFDINEELEEIMKEQDSD